MYIPAMCRKAIINDLGTLIDINARSRVTVFISAGPQHDLLSVKASDSVKRKAKMKMELTDYFLEYEDRDNSDK